MRSLIDVYHVLNANELIKNIIRNAQPASTRRGGQTETLGRQKVVSGARGRGACVLAAGTRTGMDRERLHQPRRLDNQYTANWVEGADRTIRHQADTQRWGEASRGVATTPSFAQDVHLDAEED